MERISVNGRDFSVLRLLGKGKGGYSYLVTDGNAQYVCKQLHHEPCAYYQFSNKLEAERRDYARLCAIGIRMPQLLDIDAANERILKEFIDGERVDSLVLTDRLLEDYVNQLKQMCLLLYAANTNIDYFPTNFIARDGLLYYVDYECNDYMQQWDFEHWGCKYWSKTPEFLAHFGNAK